MGYVTYRLGALSGPAQVPHSVICEQAERVIEPCRTPPVPAEAPTIPRPHQVAPDLPLDPPLHYGKAPARVPDPEVVDPAPQLRVDRGDQLLGRLGLIASEYLLELLQQRRTLLPLWRILRPPAPPHRADAPEVEAQKSKALPPIQVHDPALLLVQLHIEFRQLFSQPSVYRLHQPVLPTIVVHEDHQVIGVARVLDVRVRAVGRDHLGPLQHRIHLREVDVAEEGGDHAPLRNPALPGGFQHQLHQVQDVSVVHPTLYLGEQQVVPHAVEVRSEINVNYSRLVPHDGFGHPVDRLLGCPLRSIPIRPVVKVGFKDRLQDQLERPLDHPVPNRRNPQDADLPAALGDLDAPVPPWPVGACDQFLPELPQKPLHAGVLNGRKRHPVDARSAVVLLGQRVVMTNIPKRHVTGDCRGCRRYVPALVMWPSGRNQALDRVDRGMWTTGGSRPPDRSTTLDAGRDGLLLVGLTSWNRAAGVPVYRVDNVPKGGPMRTRL